MPKHKNTLGTTLIKAYKRSFHGVVTEGFRHTGDVTDLRDDHSNLKSITDQTSLEEFLDKVAIADENYELGLEEIKILDSMTSDGLLSEEEKQLVCSAQDKNKNLLCIPRRPPWDKGMSKQELDKSENKAFDIWKQKLVLLEKEEHIILTPFERNLEFWRQLWRVIERSDVVVQILDARNPLLFRCPDLETYVKQNDERKINALLLNKADLLTETQRQCWSDYFDKVGIQIIFFSALQQGERSPEDICDESAINIPQEESLKDGGFKNTSKIFSKEELVSFLKMLSKPFKTENHYPTIGLVGYPNVGKSSTVNALLTCKKVSVSATPGKTKHFQTHHIDDDLCLCDCPGLVFPNFVSTRAEMVINGILPIDTMKEWNQPVSLVTSLIPRHILESTYSILIPPPGEDRDPDSPPTAIEFLNAHGMNRGYMTHRGLPDNARSSRYVLKDFVSGRLLYCVAPPGVDQADYHVFEERGKPRKAVLEDINEESTEKSHLTESDKRFFQKALVHAKGKPSNKLPNEEIVGKPWKKHNNRNKKQKLRKVYAGTPYD